VAERILAKTKEWDIKGGDVRMNEDVAERRMNLLGKRTANMCGVYYR
jgi:hypothetical protein